MKRLPFAGDVITYAGGKLRVERRIGSGGQGDVFLVSRGNQQLALKWHPRPRRQEHLSRYSEIQRAIRDDLTKRAPPDKRFLWPEAYVEAATIDGFGYIMPLAKKGSRDLNHVVAGRLDPIPDRVLCEISINLAECFRSLHLKGLVYKDINLGGPLIIPQRGEVAICDCDNVREQGHGGRIYFAQFAAPEVLQGKPNTVKTDDHSLAVLLFYLFVRGHPLEGVRMLKRAMWSTKEVAECYGSKPVFIFDPKDDSNRPVKGQHDQVIQNWNTIPAFLRKAFTTVFTGGLQKPARRISDGAWVRLFSNYLDSLFPCPHCRKEIPYPVSSLPEEETFSCVGCRTFIDIAAVPWTKMTIGNKVIMLSEGKTIRPVHIGNNGVFGKVWQTKMGLSLKNEGSVEWTFETRDGIRSVAPGKALVLKNGLRLNFGAKYGVVSSQK